MKPFGFVIITYNRQDDLLELLESISLLEGKEDLLQEVVIVNNGSTTDYTPVKKYIQSRPDMPFRYFDAPENLGVARGRNFAFEKTNAPIMIIVDDDIIIYSKDCLLRLHEEFNSQNTQKIKAVVSFRVLYSETLAAQKTAFPHKNFDEYGEKPFFETSYYPGCAHAMKKEILLKTGYYPEDFFYGMEEYDLSYRILEAGYCMVYTNKIVLHHKESPLGRKPKKEKLQMMWMNKTRVAYRYLPKKYFYSTAFIWSFQYLKETNFNLSGFFSGWKKVLGIPGSVKRTPISTPVLQYLKQVKARLWY